MASVFDQLADAFTQRKLALAERKRPKSKLAGSDYFMPKSSKEDLAQQQRILDEEGLPGVLKEGAKKMYENPVVNTAISLAPGAGDIQSGYEAWKSAREGDWTSAGLNAVGVLPFVPALAGTFVGKSSKTWDAVQAAEALKRLEAGEDAAQVYKDTGYAISPWDKQLRKEISDVPARMKPTEWTTPYEDIPNYHQSTIGGSVEHPELFNAYPEYKETGLYLNPSMDSRASWHKADPELGLESYMQWKIDKNSALNTQEDWVKRLNDPKSEDYWKTQVKRDMEGPFAYNSEEEGMATMKDYVKEQETKLENMRAGQLNETPSDILHEVQHGIQETEGWARGGSPKEFAYDKAKAFQEIETVNNQLDMLSRSIDSAKAEHNYKKAEQYKQMYDEAMDYKLTELVPRANIEPVESYNRLAGEAEARLVQRRRNLTEEQMRQAYPYDPAYFYKQTDVPISSLIVKYDKTKDINK